MGMQQHSGGVGIYIVLEKPGQVTQNALSHDLDLAEPTVYVMCNIKEPAGLAEPTCDVM